MAWVRLDDGFPTHPKVLGISDEAFRLHVSAMCYASQHQTDGFIPEAFVSGHEDALKELTESGLWDPDPVNGYFVHDFLIYNPSRADRRSRSESAAGAARMRWAKQMESEAPATRMPDVLGDGEGVGDVEHQGGSGGDAFEQFWAAYPRKQSKQGARRKFEKAVKQVPAAVIIAGAERYRDDPNREPEFTKLPTTWLNNGCWEDESLPARSGPPRDPYRNIPDFTKGK